MEKLERRELLLGVKSEGAAPGMDNKFSFKIINYSQKKVNIQKNILTL